MTIDTFLDFSETAASNVDVAGIGIQGTNAVQNFDNAFRQLMAILRRDLDNGIVLTSKSAGYTAVANDNNALIRFSAAATLSLTAAATLGANWHCWVMADGGAVVIDPNSSETINGATTITIPDGSSTLVICDGTNFRALEDYSLIAAKADAIQATVDVASATTTDIGAAASWNIRITGTTTITGLGTVAEGTLRFVRMAGALTLTHNGTSLILPGSTDILTAANDCFLARSLGSGNWLVMFYQKAALSPVVLGTVQATTSGTSKDFTGVPSWAKMIVVTLNSFSANAINVPIIQIGDSGGIETSGYLGSGGDVAGGTAGLRTDGFAIGNGLAASSVLNGSVTLTLHDPATNTWVAQGVCGVSSGAQVAVCGGAKPLSAALDRVRFTTSSAATFDLGSVNIAYF